MRALWSWPLHIERRFSPMFPLIAERLPGADRIPLTRVRAAITTRGGSFERYWLRPMPSSGVRGGYPVLAAAVRRTRARGRRLICLP
jgi:hypothetical protein